MKPSLKREVVKGLQAEGALNMLEFGNYKRLSKLRKKLPGEKNCHTACCLAGHIIAAAARLDLPIPTGRDVKRTVSKDERGYPDWAPEARIARVLWAEAYGEKESKRLQFVSGSNILRMSQVTPEQAVAHVRGAPATW